MWVEVWVLEKFYLKAIAGDGDVNSAALVVKAWERKAELLGLDAVQRIDLQIMQPPQAETRHDKIRRVIWELCRPGQPMPDDPGDYCQQLNDGDDSPQPRRLNGGSPPDPEALIRRRRKSVRHPPLKSFQN